jgi:hypothetical protein
MLGEGAGVLGVQQHQVDLVQGGHAIDLGRVAQVTLLRVDSTGFWPRTKRKSNAIGRFLPKADVVEILGRLTLSNGVGQEIL